MATSTEKPRRTPARRTLLPWVGGKSRSAAAIVAALPAHHTYVEVFCGGCAVLWRKPRSPVEIVNDADARLVGLLRVARYHPEALAAELAGWQHSRADFDAALAQPGVTDVQRAARFLFILAACFGGKVNGKPTFGYSRAAPAEYSRAWMEATIRALHERLARVTIEQGDFAAVVARYDAPGTLFYCDPPYAGAQGYAEAFGVDEHRRLRKTLGNIQGRALVSLGADRATQALYAGWEARPLDVKYSLGGKDVDRGRATREVLLFSPERA